MRPHSAAHPHGTIYVPIHEVPTHEPLIRKYLWGAGGGVGLKYASVNHGLLYDLRKPVIKIKDAYNCAYLKKNK